MRSVVAGSTFHAPEIEQYESDLASFFDRSEDKLLAPIALLPPTPRRPAGRFAAPAPRRNLLRTALTFPTFVPPLPVVFPTAPSIVHRRGLRNSLFPHPALCNPSVLATRGRVFPGTARHRTAFPERRQHTISHRTLQRRKEKNMVRLSVLPH